MMNITLGGGPSSPVDSTQIAALVHNAPKLYYGSLTYG